MLSYLPYAHAFEQAVFLWSITGGASHGYYSGDPLLLLQDIQAVRPTLFCTVPRILNRFYDKIWDSVRQKGGMKQWLFEKAVASKTYYLQNEGTFSHRFYDRVFEPIRNMFGGRVNKFLIGSAPISGDVLTFFKVALGCHIHEAYGQTEVSAPGTLTHPTDPFSGHVGGPPPEMKIRLRDVPEMNYFTSDNPPKGEV